MDPLQTDNATLAPFLTAEDSHGKLRAILTELLQDEIVRIDRIGGGRNSRVYRALGRTVGPYAIKFYFRHHLDPRNRLHTEAAGLRFLWEHGVRDVPRPVLESNRWGCGVYEYVEGGAIPSAQVGAADVDQAILFLATLKEISRQPGSDQLATASEACFTIQDIVQSVERRLDRLVRGPGADPAHPALAEFLTTSLVPSFQHLVGWCHERLRTGGLSSEQELSGAERTLSPSDFGFHNALRRSDGRLVFLDFEYFGWDDPAKMVADFLLHPAMELTLEQRRQFVRGILERFPDGPGLRERLRTVYPLFGLKWCTILLNEFLPEHLARRGFASAAALSQAEVQARQLAKARHMLERVMRDYEPFPYDS